MTKRKKASPKPRKRANRTPPFAAYEAWSEAKFWSFIRSGLRSKHSRWPPAQEALKNARRAYKGPNKRQKYEYKCAVCKKWWKQTEVERDHIVACGSLRSFADLAGFVERMFVGVTGYRIVCKPCHLTITKEAKNEDLGSGV